MKKHLLLYISVIFLFSCTKEVVVKPGQEWINDPSLPVPVEFKSSAVSVKAKSTYMGPVSGTVLNDLNVGVYGVELGSTTDEWQADGSNFFINNVNVLTDAEGNIAFSPKLYYPVENNHNYSFFSYYPYTTDVTVENGQILANFDVGHYDLLWASTIAETLEDGTSGYNATYVRKAALTEPEKLPSLTFTHKLAGIKFYVKRKYPATTVPINLTGIRINGVYTKLSLVLADKTDYTNAGTIIGSEQGNISMCSATSAETTTELGVVIPVDNEQGTLQGTLAGIPLMICPSNNALSVSFETEVNGRRTWYEGYVLQSPADNKRFDAGKMYTFTLVYDNPEEVMIPTVLTAWQEIDGGIIEF